MFFWKKKGKDQQQDTGRDEEDKLLHPDGEPNLEPPTEYDAEISKDFKDRELDTTESHIIDEIETTPTPEHTKIFDAVDAEEERKHDRDEEKGGWFSKLADGLSKSSNKMGQGIVSMVAHQKVDDNIKDELEEILITADLGPVTANKIVEAFAEKKFGSEVSEQDIREALADEIDAILEPVARTIKIEKPDNGPFVILVSGVNGAGKTTTIGKFAHYLQREQGLKVMMAAGDTFRAAATEQLEEWARRNGCGIYTKDVGADAAALAYEAYDQAKDQGMDVLLIDTAGRLQNKSNLMDELKKIVRVLQKHDKSLPHESLLVLDATTGQNAFSQVDIFKKMVNISGLVITKLDGSAKGGVVVGLADKYGLPIYAVGVGEKTEDLQPFHPREFAQALCGA